jgi:hypothetical protein
VGLYQEDKWKKANITTEKWRGIPRLRGMAKCEVSMDVCG